MGWEDRQKEEILKDFYLEAPEEKIYYPIDLLWDFNGGKGFKLESNWSANIEEGRIKTIHVSELKLKKNKLHGR